MKKKITFLFFGFLVLANFIVLNVSALPVDGGGGGGLVCKWAQFDCPSGTQREVCLEDGDGNTCTCGSVTRPC